MVRLSQRDFTEKMSIEITEVCDDAADPEMSLMEPIMNLLQYKRAEVNDDEGIQATDDEGIEAIDDEGTETEYEKPKNSCFLKYFDYPEGVLLLLGLTAIVLDPLFFYVPTMKNSSSCLGLDKVLRIVLVLMRTFVDMAHDLSWWSKGLGRSEYYKTKSPGRSSKTNEISSPRGGSSKQARVKNLLTWLKGSPILSPDARSSWEARVLAMIASLPLPQVLVFAVGLQSHLKTWLKFVVTFQFAPRIWRCCPTYIAAVTSFSMYPWMGAAFNLLLFALASHILGGFWYLRAVERKMDCMKGACQSILKCEESFLYCETDYHVISGNLSDTCAEQPSNGIAPFDYGMYYDAIHLDLIGSNNLIKKVSGSFWWAINKLSSSGLDIVVGTYIWDTYLAIFICFLGLILLALFIGNAQLYLQSTRPSTLVRLKEKREKLLGWPPFSSLPEQLKKEIIRCQHPKWQEVREIDLGSLFNNIPWQLRWKLKPYFCEKLFYKVKEFEELDNKAKEALRERASAVVFQEGTNIHKERYPIYKMIHIVQGKVLAFNKNDAIRELRAKELKEDDSFGKELLLKALESPRREYPLAKKTIRSITKVEAFALSLDDFVKAFTKYGSPPNESYRKKRAIQRIKDTGTAVITIQKLKNSHQEGKDRPFN